LTELALNIALDVALDDAAFALGKQLEAAGWVVGTAESCTGGLIARALTERSGSSAWFDRSVVTYSNAAKADLLDVPWTLFDEFGAVSEQCASKMAYGLLGKLGAEGSSVARKSDTKVIKPAVAISVTGIAGPTGAVPGKPVGTVCFGCALRSTAGLERIETTTKYFAGDRSSVRTQAALYALEFARKVFQSPGFEQATLMA
jgi:nicotinamide-nucleotide amidase